MKNSAETALAFSVEREAIAATSESSHCIIAGSTRRCAIEAAPRIPHLTLLLIVVSARCHKNVSVDGLAKQPNQKSSDSVTAYRIWPAKRKSVLKFLIDLRSNCLEREELDEQTGKSTAGQRAE